MAPASTRIRMEASPRSRTPIPIILAAQRVCHGFSGGPRARRLAAHPAAKTLHCAFSTLVLPAPFYRGPWRVSRRRIERFWREPSTPGFPEGQARSLLSLRELSWPSIADDAPLTHPEGRRAGFGQARPRCGEQRALGCLNLRQSAVRFHPRRTSSSSALAARLS